MSETPQEPATPDEPEQDIPLEEPDPATPGENVPGTDPAPDDQEPAEPATDAEPDPDDPATDTEPDPDGQTTAEQPVDEKEIEKAFKNLAKVRDYVARRVGEIMGDDATQLIPCPACSDLAPGFVWPPHVAALSPEAEAGTRLLLGMQQPTDLSPHPNATICETCDGKGQVQTPSKVPGYDVVDCPTCAATGRILTSNVTPLAPVPSVPMEAATVTGPTVMDQPMSPEAEAAKAQGYMVIPPFNPGAPAPTVGTTV